GTVVLAAVVGAAAALGVVRATGGWGNRTVVQQQQQQQQGDRTSGFGDRPADIQGVLARVLPSVVSIDAESPASPFFRGKGAQVTRAFGTGIVVTADGDVVTNDHVVDGASSVTVEVAGSGGTFPATVVYEEPLEDLAVLHLSGATGLVPAVLGDSTRVAVGDGVLAIGFALALSGAPSVTSGIVSAVGRAVPSTTASGLSFTMKDMIQTDAAVSSGNSGGPLVDDAAEVIGINTLVAVSSGAVTAQNIGFAVPSATIAELLAAHRSGGP
ncbi:MAG: S1C family serine protease, partial [Gemmatimonadales bacterium]